MRLGSESPPVLRCVFAHDHPFIVCGDHYASRAGFPESILQRYANAFGHLDVICRSQIVDSTTLPPIMDPRIHFHPVANVRSLGGLRLIGRVRAEIAAIVAKADCVVVRLPSTIGLLCAVEAARQGKPFVVEVVGNAFEANLHHGAVIGPAIALIEHTLCKMVVRRAPAAVYITQRYLQSLYPTNGRVFVCPNVQIDEVATQAAAARPSRLETDRWTLGLVGSLDVNYKGHGVAISALAQMKARMPHAELRLEFVGGGDPARWRRAARAAGVANDVKFLGTLPPGAAMKAWHDTIDIVLQPSQVEAQGRSIIEAMSRGRPVLASTAGGIPELLSNDCLIDPRDAVGLADLATALIQNSECYEATARRNLEVSKDFLKPVVERQRAEVFEYLRSQISSMS